MKLHLPKLKFPHFTKHVLTVLGIALVVAIVLLGAAVATHEKRVADSQAAHDAQVQAAKDKQTQAVISQLKAQNTQLSSDKKAACDYISGLTLAKSTKSLVILPTSTNCPTPKK